MNLQQQNYNVNKQKLAHIFLSTNNHLRQFFGNILQIQFELKILDIDIKYSLFS